MPFVVGCGLMKKCLGHLVLFFNLLLRRDFMFEGRFKKQVIRIMFLSKKYKYPWNKWINSNLLKTKSSKRNWPGTKSWHNTDHHPHQQGLSYVQTTWHKISTHQGDFIHIHMWNTYITYRLPYINISLLYTIQYNTQLYLYP